jgi:hypothetical protein
MLYNNTLICGIVISCLLNSIVLNSYNKSL